MPDYTARATMGASATYGTASAVVKVRAPEAMTAMETDAVRFDIEPYTVNRGDFLPGDPHIKVAVSVYGIISGGTYTGWEWLAEKGVALWDGASCGQLWGTVPGSEPLNMYSQPDQVVAVLPNVPGDATCVRKFRAAHVVKNAKFETGSKYQAQSVWALVAVRQVVPSNGRLMAMGLYGQTVGISYYANGLVFEIVGADGIPVVIGSHSMDMSGRYIPIVAISTDPGVVRIMVRDSKVPTVYTWETAGNIVVDTFTIGGSESPESIIYAAAMGGGGNAECERYLRLIAGYVS